MGIAGFMFQTVGNMNMQYGINAVMKHAYAYRLAHESAIGPNMHPQGRNLFRPGQILYSFGIYAILCIVIYYYYYIVLYSV